MINYRVQQLEAPTKKSIPNGVTIVDELPSYDYGKFIHIMDAGGNRSVSGSRPEDHQPDGGSSYIWINDGMNRYLHALMFISLAVTLVPAWAQTGSAEKQIIRAMNAAAEQWNRGDLDGYMSLYDSAATMMMPQGRAGTGGMRALYEKYYFENGRPKQVLAYDTYEFTPLGKDYALLTGRFILKANEKMKERTGTFSLVFVRRGHAWKILHDHSG